MRMQLSGAGKFLASLRNMRRALLAAGLHESDDDVSNHSGVVLRAVRGVCLGPLGPYACFFNPAFLF